MTRQKLLRLVEIAEILGVSKQRAHQLADEDDFRDLVEQDGRGRLWNRRQVGLGRRSGEPRSRGADRIHRCHKDIANGTSEHEVVIEYDYVGFDPTKPDMKGAR